MGHHGPFPGVRALNIHPPAALAALAALGNEPVKHRRSVAPDSGTAISANDGRCSEYTAKAALLQCAPALTTQGSRVDRRPRQPLQDNPSSSHHHDVGRGSLVFDDQTPMGSSGRMHKKALLPSGTRYARDCRTLLGPCQHIHPWSLLEPVDSSREFVANIAAR